MRTSVTCPYCKSVLPPSAPGIVHCGRCGGALTVPGPEELARQEKKRRDERLILILACTAIFLVYVAPVLLVLGYACFSMAFYLLMFLGMGIGSAAGA